jgi:hypothetical protein
MTTIHIHDRLRFRDELLKILEDAQTERKLRDKWIDGELGWVVYERQVMFNAVNAKRKSLGKEAISMKDLEQAESSACGHCDYSKKFAFYCAELVIHSIDEVMKAVI